MPLGRRLLDLGLPLEQPVQGRVEIVGLERIEVEHRAQSRHRRLRMRGSRRGEHAGGDQRHTAVALGAGSGGEDALDHLFRQMRKLAEGFMLDLAVFAVGAPEEAGLVEASFAAASRGVDVNGRSAANHAGNYN